MIVADTHVLAAVWMPSEEEGMIWELLRTDSEWVAPRLWRSEFRNMLSLYYRKQLLDFDTALQIMQEAEELMDQREYDVPSVRVMGKVADSACSAYDCEFVALAEDLEVPLISFDGKILDEFPGIARTPEAHLA